MDYRKRSAVVAWIGLLALTIAPAWAQQPTAPAAEAAPVVEKASPAVQAILETKPTTPTEMTRAAKILSDLDRPDLAKKFLGAVLGAKLDQKALAGLEAKFGSAMFLQMAAKADLAPEARQLADAVLGAAQAELTDPKRLTSLVDKLNDPATDVRFMAMDQLRRAGGAAVEPLLDVLADPKRKADQANVMAALVRLKSDAIGPLLGILDGGSPALKVAAIEGLAALDARQTAIYLLAPFATKKADPKVAAAAKAALQKMFGGALPSNEEAAMVLARRAKNYLDFHEPLTVDENDRVAVWTWDAAKKRPVAKLYARNDAYRLYAARFASDAYAIEPDDPKIRRLYLAAILEEAAYAAGLDKPLGNKPGSAAAIAAGLGVDVLDDLLVYAMDEGRWAAATATARLLGENGKSESLLHNGAKPAPLVVAARQPNRRLRFAAIEAIMKLAPTEPYAGSSDVLDAMGFFVSTSGTRRALVAGPVTADSMRIGGYLAPMGYEIDTALSARDLIRLAVASPDYELLLIDSTLPGAPPDILVQQLRHDYRTAGLPVGILARSAQKYRAVHMASGDPLAAAFARPYTEEDGQAIATEVLALAGAENVPHDQRMRQATKALTWIASLSKSDQKIYDLQRMEDAVMAALDVPQLRATAAAVLGELGTPRAQKTLADLASRFTLPIKFRQAAADALKASIRRHGIQLTSAEILLQYDRYNQSRDRDADTQRVLSEILDAIEAPSKGASANEPTQGDKAGNTKSKTSNSKQTQNPKSK